MPWLAGIKIQVLREERGLTQQEFAEMYGGSQSAVHLYETSAKRAGREMSQSIERASGGFVELPDWGVSCADTPALRARLARELRAAAAQPPPPEAA